MLCQCCVHVWLVSVLQALIWDLSNLGTQQDLNMDPILAYYAQSEVNQLQWSSAQPDWVAICFANKTQILRV